MRLSLSPGRGEAKAPGWLAPPAKWVPEILARLLLLSLPVRPRKHLARAVSVAALGLAFAVAAAPGAFAATTTARTWQRWQRTFHSRSHYANPYADVTLRVTYTGPGGRTLRTYGFWDGGDVFRIRCAFPAAGLWHWHTTCSPASDRALNDQSGDVRVVPYAGTNPLYRHGFLRVSDNHRYLCFADGKPFLWVGDTAWVGPEHSTVAEWREYLKDRIAKHYTVIQIGPAPWWAGKVNREGQPPFLGDGNKEWNPAFWQDYARKVDMANDAGFAVLMVGVMEPTYRYPPAADAELFARSIVARLYDNFIMFSPSFDSGYRELGNQVGEALRNATSVHLVTQHPGTTTGHSTNTIAEAYADKPYLDFHGDQTGHNGGNLKFCTWQAVNWNLHLYNDKPTKPVINLEAMYDVGRKNVFNAHWARALAYLSWFSGAMGYTCGSDLYQWDNDPSKPSYWRKAMAMPSSEQMKYLHDFLASLPWWELEPAHDRIVDQPAEPTKWTPLAQTHDGKLALVYVPSQAPVKVKLDGLRGPMTVRWFNPRTGEYAGAAAGARATLPASGVRTFTPPAAGDWVLVLKG